MQNTQEVILQAIPWSLLSCASSNDLLIYFLMLQNNLDIPTLLSGDSMR